MFGKNQTIDYGDFEVGSEGMYRRSRQNSLQALGRTQRASKKRIGRKRSAQPIMGISHRRNHKWSW